jgi:hypothetical protein
LTASGFNGGITNKNSAIFKHIISRYFFKTILFGSVSIFCVKIFVWVIYINKHLISNQKYLVCFVCHSFINLWTLPYFFILITLKKALMESLTRTPFFCMLLQQNDASQIEALSLTYKEFMTQLVHVSTNPTRDIPAFFTLNYTYIELMALKEEYKARGVKKKCSCRTLFVQSYLGC